MRIIYLAECLTIVGMNERKLILSVDGGGSSSQVALYVRADKGIYPQTVFQAEIGPLSRKSSDADTVLGSLEALHELIADYMDYISIAVLGLSGLDNGEDFDEIASLLYGAQLIGIDDDSISTNYMQSIRSTCGFPIVLCSDAILPLFACGYKEGAVLISGTGSIALRIYPDGDIRRFGGWGYRVSDEGSGYWIGTEFIREALHAAENVLVTAPGHQMLMQTPVIVRDGWIATIGYESASLAIPNPRIAASSLCLWALDHDDPKDFARIAQFALESNAPEAHAIVARAAGLLARIATLACRDTQTLVISGGLFKNERFERAFSQAFEKACPSPVNVFKPSTPITYGAYELGVHLLNQQTESSMAK